MSTKDSGTDSYDLFMGALDVTNDALEKLRDKPVFSGLVHLMEDNAEGKKFGVAVYGDDPDKPHDYYTVRIQNRKIQLASRGKDSPDIDWKVSMDYLKSINENPEAYVEAPWKLDVDWLKHRLLDAA